MQTKYGTALGELAMQDYTLIDDGTLDTVLECNICGETIRCQPEIPLGYADEDEANAERIIIAMDIAAEHDCPCDCGLGTDCVRRNA